MGELVGCAELEVIELDVGFLNRLPVFAHYLKQVVSTTILLEVGVEVESVFFLEVDRNGLAAAQLGGCSVDEGH